MLARWPDKAPAIAIATKYLSDGDPLFAVAAANALGRIGGDGGKATLRHAETTESRVTVKAAIVQALARK